MDKSTGLESYEKLHNALSPFQTIIKDQTQNSAGLRNFVT
jgi:hypothetical protein